MRERSSCCLLRQFCERKSDLTALKLYNGMKDFLQIRTLTRQGTVRGGFGVSRLANSPLGEPPRSY